MTTNPSGNLITTNSVLWTANSIFSAPTNKEGDPKIFQEILPGVNMKEILEAVAQEEKLLH